MRPLLKTQKTKGKPDLIDINAGVILRALRVWRSLSQEELGKIIGVTFQQIQKYERGTNRMAASTLYNISRALDVSVIEFFAGLEGVLPDTRHFQLSKDEIRLLKTYRDIRDPHTQKHVIKLVKTMANCL